MRKTTFFKTLFLAVALLVGNAAWGTEVEFVFADQGYTNGQDVPSGTINTDLLFTAPSGSTPSRYYDTGTGLRVYNGGSFIITPQNGITITNITLTFAGTGYTFNSADANPTVWTGSSTAEVTFNSTRTSRLQKINITYTAASSTQAITPQISATGAEKATDTYFNTAEITLSSDTDGASIYYTTNGDAPTDASTLYTAPFSITETKTIKAIAIKAGLDNSTVSEKTITIVAPATATQPYTELFENTLGDWYNYEVAGSKPWVASTNGAYGNGYGGGDVDSWLISPKFTAVGDGIALSFNYASKYVGNPLIIKISSDYLGYGDPSAATWSELSTIDAPTVQDNDYTVKASGDIIAETTGTVYFALVYQNSANPYSDWRITNASVSDYTTPVGPTIIVTETDIPAMEAEAGLTDTETISVSGVELTADITVTIEGDDAAMFEATPTTITETDGEASATVTITYRPTTPGSHTATLKLNSTDATEITRDLTGTATLTIPLATAATGITENQFNANWETVAGATEYNITVYTQDGFAVETGEYGFADGSNPPEGWTFTGISSTYSTTDFSGLEAPSVKFDSNDDAITTPILEGDAIEISFWARGASTDENSALLVEGYNGTDWVTIENIVPLPTSGQIYAYNSTSSPVLPENLIQFRFTYAKSVGNLALDDLAAAYNAPNMVEIEGSPFSVSDTNSKLISGLTENTVYYYHVTALNNGSFQTDESNKITLTTSTGTGLENVNSNMKLRYSNGNILFNTTAGQSVEIYNTVGQKLIKTISTEGLNTIPVNIKAILFVKVGDQVSKLIAR